VVREGAGRLPPAGREADGAGSTLGKVGRGRPVQLGEGGGRFASSCWVALLETSLFWVRDPIH
jgi:hypothetical protein